MEMVLNDGFCEMTHDEMEKVDGGGRATTFCGVFFGTVSLAWSPIVAIICPPAGAGMALTGIGLIGKGTGLY